MKDRKASYSRSGINVRPLCEKYRPAASVMADRRCEELITSHAAAVQRQIGRESELSSWVRSLAVI